MTAERWRGWHDCDGGTWGFQSAVCIASRIKDVQFSSITGVIGDDVIKGCSNGVAGFLFFGSVRNFETLESPKSSNSRNSNPSGQVDLSKAFAFKDGSSPTLNDMNESPEVSLSLGTSFTTEGLSSVSKFVLIKVETASLVASGLNFETYNQNFEFLSSPIMGTIRALSSVCLVPTWQMLEALTPDSNSRGRLLALLCSSVGHMLLITGVDWAGGFEFSCLISVRSSEMAVAKEFNGDISSALVEIARKCEFSKRFAQLSHIQNKFRLWDVKYDSRARVTPEHAFIWYVKPQYPRQTTYSIPVTASEHVPHTFAIVK